MIPLDIVQVLLVVELVAFPSIQLADSELIECLAKGCAPFLKQQIFFKIIWNIVLDGLDELAVEAVEGPK